MKKIWDMPVKEIPVVAGALGMTPKKLKQRFSDIGIEIIVELRKTIVFYFARILRNVLEV